MDFSHIRAGYLRRFIYECKWGINFSNDPAISLYIYNAYLSAAQQKKVASESSIDYLKYTGFSIYPAYVAMEKFPLKMALICEAEGRKIIILIKKRHPADILFMPRRNESLEGETKSHFVRSSNNIALSKYLIYWLSFPSCHTRRYSTVNSAGKSSALGSPDHVFITSQSIFMYNGRWQKSFGRSSIILPSRTHTSFSGVHRRPAV